MQRKDDYKKRGKHLTKLSDEQLNRRFWQLADKIVDPLIDLAKTHTSPSIERSVLLRMGFDSLDAKTIVSKCVEKGFLGKGAGNIVLRLSKSKNVSIEQAGQLLKDDKTWAEISGLF